MTKIELMEKLAAIHGNPKVLISSDAQGNGHGELRDVELSATNHGEPCHPDDADETGHTVIMLWP